MLTGSRPGSPSSRGSASAVSAPATTSPPPCPDRVDSVLAEPDAPDGVVGALLQHEVGAGAGGRDIVTQVHGIDLAPDGIGDAGGCALVELGEVVEEGALVEERGLAQGQEPLGVPGVDVLLV